MAGTVLKLVARPKKPAKVKNPAPTWLSKAARAEWLRLRDLLEKKGTLTAENKPLLADYCGAQALIAQCDKELGKSRKLLIRGPGGIAKPHPLIGARNRASQNAISLAKKLGIFGASPNSSQGGAGDADPYARLGI